jgi:hypothetical protein
MTVIVAAVYPFPKFVLLVKEFYATARFPKILRQLDADILVGRSTHRLCR